MLAEHPLNPFQLQQASTEDPILSLTVRGTNHFSAIFPFIYLFISFIVCFTVSSNFFQFLKFRVQTERIEGTGYAATCMINVLYIVSILRFFFLYFYLSKLLDCGKIPMKSVCLLSVSKIFWSLEEFHFFFWVIIKIHCIFIFVKLFVSC